MAFEPSAVRAPGSVRASVVLTLLVGGGGCEPRPPAPAAGITRLAESLPRRFEARVSGPFSSRHCGAGAFAPCAFPEPGSEAFETLAAVTAEARVARAGGAGPVALRLAALTTLIWSDGAGEPPSEAVDLLTAAARAHPRDADIRADLAAVHLVMASRSAGAAHAVRALDAAEAALALDPDHSVAAHNRALALEMLRLVPEAEAAWRRAAASQNEVEWAEEALRHAERMAEAEAKWPDVAEALRDATDARLEGDATALTRLQDAARRDPRAARTLALDTLLPGWAQAHLKGDADAAEAFLSAAEAVALPLEDGSVRGIATRIRAAMTAGRGDALVATARGLEAIGRGADAYGTDRPREAARDYAAAAAILEGVEPTGAAWARYGEAGSRLRMFEYEAATHLTSPLLHTEVLPDDAPALQGLAGWVAGLVEGREGRYGRAADEFAAAIVALERSGESQNLAAVRGLQGEVRRLLGDPGGAWDSRVGALAAIPSSARLARHRVVFEAAEAARLEGHLWAARVFQDVAVDAIGKDGAPNLRAEGLARRSRILLALGDTSAARRDATAAAAAAEDVQDADVAARTHADLWDLQARMAGPDEGGRRTAMARLDSALFVQRSLGNRTHLPDLHLARGRLRLPRDRPGAASDLDSALTLLEESTTGGLVLADRVRFAETAGALTAFAAELKAQGAMTAADLLDVVERVGALAWPGAAAHAVGDRFVPAGEVVVRYLSSDAGLLVWVLREDGLEFVTLPTSREAVADARRALRRAVRGPDDPEQLRRSAARLGGLVLPDTVLGLLGHDAVVFVPDRELNGTPFSVLPGAGGTMLVEERAVVVAPTVALHLAAAGVAAGGAAASPTGAPSASGSATVPASGRDVRAGAEPPGRGRRVVLLGDPRVADTVAFPVLHGARDEISSLQALYPGARAFTGAEAGRRALLASSGADVLHFAGHAVSTPDQPAASHLVLAPPEEGAGSQSGADLLYGWELAEADFVAPTLVVLTACASIAPDASDGGGFWGVAYPFLARGSRAVVGTLWPVEDRAAGRMSVMLHEELTRGLPLRDALRAARLRARAGGAVPVRVWSAFELLGA